MDPMDHRGAPLHLAVSEDRVEVVKVLLEHGADVSLPVPFQLNECTFEIGNENAINFFWFDDLIFYS